MAATTYLQELISQGDTNKLKTAHVGLWTQSPGIGGSLAGEVSAGEYTRLLVPWDPGQILLLTDTSLAWAQVASDWGFIDYVVLCDSATGVNVLAYEQLPSIVEAPTGSTVTIALGNLSVVIQ